MRDLHKFRTSALAGHPPYRVDHQPPSGSVLQPLLITVIIWVWSRTMTFLLWLQKEERSWSFFINNLNPGYSMTIQISRYSPSYGNKKALWWNAYSVLSDGSPVLILISSVFKGRWQLVNSFKYLILKSFCYSPHSLWGRYYDYSYFTKEENTLPPLSPHSYPKGTMVGGSWDSNPVPPTPEPVPWTTLLYCLLLVGGSWGPGGLLSPSWAQVLQFLFTNSFPS